MTPSTVLNLNNYKNGDLNAGRLLLEEHARFITSVVSKYKGRDWEWDDTMQVAKMAFLEACKRFDPKKAGSILTYAYHYIHGYIIRSHVMEGSVVRFPANQYKSDRYKYRARYVFCFSEMADRMNEWSEMSFEETLVDEDPSIEDNLCDQDLKKKLIDDLSSAMNFLTEREISVLNSRFCDEPLSLEIIGKKWDLTRERIRQIENEALRKLRAKLNASVMIS